jgi:hypothetical protein
MIKLPLLDSQSRGYEYPADTDGRNICTVCGAPFKMTGFAAFDCETAVRRDRKGNSWSGFRLPNGVRRHISFEVGFECDENNSPTTSQNKSSQNRESSNKHNKIHEVVHIVKELDGNEFSIIFCSIHCMRNFFNAVLDDFSEDFCDKHGFDP